jgi:hypothetical protein
MCEEKKGEQKSRLFEFWGTRVEKRGKFVTISESTIHAI